MASDGRPDFSTGLYRRQYLSPLRSQRESRHKCEHNRCTALICLHIRRPYAPLRREGRMLSAGPVCSCAHFFVHIAHETAGAARTRSSLRPRYSGGHEPSHQLGARVACGRRGASGRCRPLAPLAGRGRNLREARMSGEGVQVYRLATCVWREPLTPTL